MRSIFFIVASLTFIIFNLSTQIFSVENETAPIQLRERFQEADPGDYVVTSQNKIYTLFHIHSKNDSVITLEEVSIPENKFNFKYIVKEKIKGTLCGSVCCAMGWLPTYDSRVKWMADGNEMLFLTMAEEYLERQEKK